jgi:hypothetical protein
MLLNGAPHPRRECGGMNGAAAANGANRFTALTLF